MSIINTTANGILWIVQTHMWLSSPTDFIILYTNVQHERMIFGFLELKDPLGLCRILDEEKNGYVARDQLLYAL